MITGWEEVETGTEIEEWERKERRKRSPPADPPSNCRWHRSWRNHKIAGRSQSLPVAEGSRSCQGCHTDAPHRYHAGEGHEGHTLLNHHLNRHTQHISCVTCHSPVYSKCIASKTWWDWSTAGDKARKPKTDKCGMPDYSWMKGDFQWAESVKPSYAWYNGMVKRHLIGDKINPAGVTSPHRTGRPPSGPDFESLSVQAHAGQTDGRSPKPDADCTPPVRP